MVVVAGLALAASGCRTAFPTRTFIEPQAPPVPAVGTAPLYVLCFSHFDRPWESSRLDLSRLRELTRRHPQVKWTHLFNPVAFTQPVAELNRLVAFVKDARDRQGAEIGLHLHMHRSFLDHCGISFRPTPTVHGANPESDVDPTGYAVPMTHYGPLELRGMLERSIALFLSNGLGRPQTFCAGYYAANNALQASLAASGFSVSAAAFPLGSVLGKNFPPAWHVLAGWNTSVDGMTLPYPVSTSSILPGGPPPYHQALDGPLLEIPQTGKIDWMMNRAEMITLFERHLDRARGGERTVVSFSLHENSAARDWDKFDAFFRAVEERSRNAGVAVLYVTAQELRSQWSIRPEPVGPPLLPDQDCLIE